MMPRIAAGFALFLFASACDRTDQPDPLTPPSDTGPDECVTTPNLVATIRVSASTNSGSIDVLVYSDGSAERTIGPPLSVGGNGAAPDPKSYAAGSPEVMTFLADLALAGDVAAIPTATIHDPGSGCAKSASFGNITALTVDCSTSGDLQCLAPPATAEATALAHDCDVLSGRRS